MLQSKVMVDSDYLQYLEKTAQAAERANELAHLQSLTREELIELYFVEKAYREEVEADLVKAEDLLDIFKGKGGLS